MRADCTNCVGAGQRVTARFGGAWNRRAFDAFTATRQLHELSWYLHETLEWDTALRPRLRDALAHTEELAEAAEVGHRQHHAVDGAQQWCRHDPMLAPATDTDIDFRGPR